MLRVQRCVANEEPKADAAIITIGRQAGEGMDRQINGEFNLSQIEQDMIFRVSDAFHAKGKKVIVIINSGSVMETASWRDRVDAILVAWQPGIEGGNSVADILTGKVNPSGKLTMTWPIAATDHPSTANFDEANSQWKVDAGNYLFKVGSDVENIKGTATLKVAEYTEKTSNACAPKVQLNYLRKN